MHFVLQHGVSFCIAAGGRPVFLDLRGDRYLCLAPHAEESFARFAAGESLREKDWRMLEELVRDGLLQRSQEACSPFPCKAPMRPRTSLLALQSARPQTIAHALSRLALAKADIHVRSLRSNLSTLASRKAGSALEGTGVRRRLEDIASAFKCCCLISSPIDRCLARSIAVAQTMLDFSISPDLVLGVRLQPFSAHCWVQHGELLVNDTLDRVRNYTPILVI